MANEFVPHINFGSKVISCYDEQIVFTIVVRDYLQYGPFCEKQLCVEKSENTPDKWAALRKVQYDFQPPRYSVVCIYEDVYKKPLGIGFRF